MNIRTDLAIEATPQQKTRSITARFDVTRTDMTLEDGHRAITISSPRLASHDPEAAEYTADFVAVALRDLMGRPESVLVVGLGNADMTCDALGPEVVKRLIVTRHYGGALCAFSPGVLGTTGIDTVDTVRGVIREIEPDCVLFVDALASRATERAGTSIQITDRGIAPGGGLLSAAEALDEDSLGLPCFSVGAPTVVHAATLTLDLLERVLGGLPAILPQAERDKLEQAILTDRLGGMVVTPKDVDLTVSVLARIVASAINDVCL